ncbi:protein ACCELERATED CELL DEATH 6-like [Amaranthus tricolor]|uniref:protein ACCELERATED CELL DEATH 6-like n=1 Tax=Amaranthus tricolor TaxID=29722 RepID=UPI002589769A|nr:protein ACCELERATED CELL DEATH 6-like [Amaranthus tricolor]
MVSRIVEKNKMLVRIQNNEGLTPLHCAAAKVNKLRLLEILVKNDYNDESSASYIQDHMGRTALHIAMLQSNWGAIEKLISLRPDCIEIVDKNGQNVLHYAAKFTCLTKLYRLIGLGHIDKLTNEKDKDGNTPFHLLTLSMPKTPDYNMHDCLYYLYTFVKLIPFMDVKVFNNEKETVGDIIYSFGNDMCPQKFVPGRYKQVERGGRIHKFERDLEVGKENSHDGIEEFDMVSLKKTAESRLVVAALIATVSFTAGFTLPGGFDQSIGQNMGMAVLKNKRSFKVFLTSDAIAFSTSTLAILFYFVLVSAKSKWTIQNFSIMALICNTISFGALMIAFIAGVWVPLSKSYRLIFAIISISMRKTYEDQGFVIGILGIDIVLCERLSLGWDLT